VGGSAPWRRAVLLGVCWGGAGAHLVVELLRAAVLAEELPRRHLVIPPVGLGGGVVVDDGGEEGEHGEAVGEREALEEVERVDELPEQGGQPREVGEDGSLGDEPLAVPEPRAGEGGEHGVPVETHLVDEPEDIWVLFPEALHPGLHRPTALRAPPGGEPPGVGGPVDQRHREALLGEMLGGPEPGPPRAHNHHLLLGRVRREGGGVGRGVLGLGGGGGQARRGVRSQGGGRCGRGGLSGLPIRGRMRVRGRFGL